MGIRVPWSKADFVVVLAVAAVAAGCGGGTGEDTAPTTALEVAEAVTTTAPQGLGSDLEVLGVGDHPLAGGSRYRFDGPGAGQLALITAPPGGAFASSAPGSIVLGPSPDPGSSYLTLYDVADLFVVDEPFQCPFDLEGLQMGSLEPADPDGLLDALAARDFVRDVERAPVDFGSVAGEMIEYSVGPFPDDAPACFPGQPRIALQYGTTSGVDWVTEEPGQRWRGVLVDVGTTSVFIHVRLDEATEAILASMELGEVPPPAGAAGAQLLPAFGILDRGVDYYSQQLVPRALGVRFTATVDGLNVDNRPGLLALYTFDPEQLAPPTVTRLLDASDVLGIGDPAAPVDAGGLLGVSPDQLLPISELPTPDVVAWLAEQEGIDVVEPPGALDVGTRRGRSVVVAANTFTPVCPIQGTCGIFLFHQNQAGGETEFLEGTAYRVTLVEAAGEGVVIIGVDGSAHDEFLASLELIEL